MSGLVDECYFLRHRSAHRLSLDRIVIQLGIKGAQKIYFGHHIGNIMSVSLPRRPKRSTFARAAFTSLYDRALEAESQLVTFHTWHRRAVREMSWLPHAWRLRESLIVKLPMLYWLKPIGLTIWVFLVQPVFLFREVWKLCQARKQCSKQTIALGESVFLGTSISDMLPTVAKSVPVPDVYLSLPWRTPVQNLPDQMKVIDLAGLVHPQDIGIALARTWKATLRHCVTPKKWHLILYGYMGFRWHIVYLTLKHIAPAELWIANHYDRWAILADGIDVSRKTMVQHGQLTMQSKTEGIAVGFQPDPKLTNSWRLLHFTPNALSEFSDYVFTSPPREQVSFSPEFEVFDPRTDKPVVLVVGSPHIYSEQMEELKALRQNFDSRIELFYRPHPRADTHSIDTILQEVKATVVPLRLPQGAICVTYPSTLNHSLENLGIKPIFDFDYGFTEKVIMTRHALYKYITHRLSSKSQVQSKCAE